MVSPPSEPHSEKAHPNSPPQINLAFKAKGPDQDPGTTQPEGNSTHLTFFPRRGARIPGAPPRSANVLHHYYPDQYQDCVISQSFASL